MFVYTPQDVAALVFLCIAIGFLGICVLVNMIRKMGEHIMNRHWKDRDEEENDG